MSVGLIRADILEATISQCRALANLSDPLTAEGRCGGGVHLADYAGSDGLGRSSLAQAARSV